VSGWLFCVGADKQNNPAQRAVEFHWTGWYCNDHAALSLDEKVRRWQQGREIPPAPPEPVV